MMESFVDVPSQNGHPCDTAGAVKEGEGDDILADDQVESSRSKQRQARCYALDVVSVWAESAGSDGSTEEVPLWQSKCVKEGKRKAEEYSRRRKKKKNKKKEKKEKGDKVEGSRREMRLKKRREGYVRASKKDASHGRPMETSTSWMACHGISRRGGTKEWSEVPGRQPARQAAGVSRQGTGTSPTSDQLTGGPFN
ncbi:uncharacterized protein ARB_01202 [Trichophyton benhamiae CBS 112371]|uniref:Uncharacterized protein n=1 Tax=Arthroderma benhamiae (strain ATCC MYA-4681 / CBS 112371) TaxID=663331 RepID=D4AYD3_ARTBC|nr:uncharacterized protein ARB_01202 [Trichophyton benhamiae CBS 112371]EFE31949.1 hypothetical protein ARB_01202 [Trichophyton benhamiae CBS 112371]